MNISNWDEAIDHLSGMYGVDPKKFFDQEKEFSIAEVIRQLDKVESCDDNWMMTNPSVEELGQHLKDKLTDDVYKAMIGEGGKYYYYDGWLDFVPED